MPPERLILTLKRSSPLGAVPLRPEIARLLDPNPDIDLTDIRLELRELESQYEAKFAASSNAMWISQRTPTPDKVKRFGGNLSDVADFGRGGFRMSLFALDSDSDEGDDGTKENAGNSSELNSNELGQHEHRDFSAAAVVDKDRVEPDWVKSPLLPQTDKIETALREVNRERLLKVLDKIRKRQVSFEEKFKEERMRVEMQLSLLETEELAKCECAWRADKQDQRLIAEARDQYLSVLQRDHEQRSQVEERAIRKEAAAEEARRRELERLKEQQLKARAEAEAEMNKRAEAERAKAAAEAAKRKAQADAAAAAAFQRAEAERKFKLEAEKKAQELAAQAAAKAVAVSAPKPRVSGEAAKLEEARLNKLKDLQDSYKHLMADPGLKKNLKVYERQIIKHLQQISATQEQVRRKSEELIQLFRASNGPPVQFLIVTLCAKCLSQCESQVQKLPSFAFALAQVIVNVASQVPFLMEAVLAQLHQVCILTVPKYFLFSKTQFETDEAYYRALGYKEEDGKLESTDDFVARMNAYMSFYAALTQTEVTGGANPHGLANAWSWCARLLNRIPANRLSASALEAFLEIAGYRLHQVYPKPFMKLMQAVVSEFLVSLRNHDDPDARASVYRLETYLHTWQFKTSPEGRDMPLRDVSSDLRE